jgi:hypothetical protein
VALRDRIVGFKHWGHTAYGEQALDMLAAFGDEVHYEWLSMELDRESARDALTALQDLAGSDRPVTDESLRFLLDQLRRDSRRRR